jgi:threonine synthase
MRYLSTRGAGPVSLAQALSEGLAADGGLYVPERLPSLKSLDPEDTLPETATQVLAPFLADSPLAPDLPGLCRRTLDLPVPLKALHGMGDSQMLELFHGPTAAFKDFAARFLAGALACLQGDANERRTVLVATSGDTGAAVAAAFHRLPGFRVVVIYPDNRVSARQAHQLEAFGDNVLTLRVAGDFDDCQRMVKQLLGDKEAREWLRPTSANSISIGRLLPQLCYYAHASVRLAAHYQGPINVVIPTGNLGNALACLMAREMGLPIGEVHFATNANRTLVDYFASGQYHGRPSLATLANAMDVGDPSNFERLQWLMQQRPDVGQAVSASSVADTVIEARIRWADQHLGETLCPHTACALEALAQKRDAGDQRPWLVVATAHPAKFEQVVEPLLGREVALPQALAELLHRPRRSECLAANVDALRQRLREWIEMPEGLAV